MTVKGSGKRAAVSSDASSHDEKLLILRTRLMTALEDNVSPQIHREAQRIANAKNFDEVVDAMDSTKIRELIDEIESFAAFKLDAISRTMSGFLSPLGRQLKDADEQIDRDGAALQTGVAYMLTRFFVKGSKHDYAGIIATLQTKEQFFKGRESGHPMVELLFKKPLKLQLSKLQAAT